MLCFFYFNALGFQLLYKSKKIYLRHSTSIYVLEERMGRNLFNYGCEWHDTWIRQLMVARANNASAPFIRLKDSRSKNGSWIQSIQTQGGSFGSNLNPDFSDSWSKRFLGKEFAKSVFGKRFRCDITLRANSSENVSVSRMLLPNRYISIKKKQNSFIVSILLSRSSSMMKNKLLAMVFKSPALCKRRMLSAQFKQRKNRFRILRLFGIEEPIWTKITNPFSDSPKETHL